jgi:hypothetical protein
MTLNNAGEFIGLIDPSGNQVDSKIFFIDRGGAIAFRSQ